MTPLDGPLSHPRVDTDHGPAAADSGSLPAPSQAPSEVEAPTPPPSPALFGHAPGSGPLPTVPQARGAGLGQAAPGVDATSGSAETRGARTGARSTRRRAWIIAALLAVTAGTAAVVHAAGGAERPQGRYFCELTDGTRVAFRLGEPGTAYAGTYVTADGIDGRLTLTTQGYQPSRWYVGDQYGRQQEEGQGWEAHQVQSTVKAPFKDDLPPQIAQALSGFELQHVDGGSLLWTEDSGGLPAGECTPDPKL